MSYFCIKEYTLCKYSNKSCTGVADDLAPINMFLYLSYSSVISLTSLKISLALLFITCFLQKQTFVINRLEKSGPAKTGTDRPVSTPLDHVI